MNASSGTLLSSMWNRSFFTTIGALTPAPDEGCGRIGVPDSSEGCWTVFEATDLNVAAPVVTLSLMCRIGSRDEIDYSDRLPSAMLDQFGGHVVKRES